MNKKTKLALIAMVLAVAAVILFASYFYKGGKLNEIDDDLMREYIERRGTIIMPRAQGVKERPVAEPLLQTNGINDEKIREYIEKHGDRY